MAIKQKAGSLEKVKSLDKDEYVAPIGVIVFVLALLAITLGGMIGAVAYFFFNDAFTPNRSVNNNISAPRFSNHAASLNGIWEIESPTYNDETVTIAFWDNSFSMITEMVIADADIELLLETIEEIREFHKNQNGAVAEVVEADDSRPRLRIILEGTFSLTESELILNSGQDMLTILPFFLGNDGISINNDRFLRKSHFLVETGD
jgi:hypothetical protein